MDGYDFSNIRALIVDDQRHMRLLLATILNELGIKTVVQAGDGQQAIEILREFKPDIIFVDYLMKPMDGIELTRKIRAGETEVSRFVPIIMLSAYTERDNIILARDAGMTEFLAKPISANLVFLRLRAVVDDPRPFVHAGGFFGPDRRRRRLDWEKADRRKIPYQYGHGKTRGNERR